MLKFLSRAWIVKVFFMRISSFWFIIFSSLICLGFNYKFISTAFGLALDVSFFAAIGIVFLLFGIFVLSFSILLLPFVGRVFLALVLIFCVFGMYSLCFYGIPISQEILISAMHTDAKEVSSYVNFGSVLYFLLSFFIFGIFSFGVKVRYASFLKELKIRLALVLGAALFIGVYFFSHSKEYIPFFRENNFLRVYLLPSYPIWQSYKLYINSKPHEFVSISQDAKLDDASQKRLFVLVVGETARRANMSLNGYSVNDTNFYTKEFNPISFEDFSSCGTFTARSVPCMFSDRPRSKFSDEYGKNSENVLDILLKVGVDVFWYDNNSGGCIGVCSRLVPDNVVELKTNGDGYDGNIIKIASQKIESVNKDTLVVIHLQGSHGPSYFQRYPSEFRRFTPTCDTSNLSSCSASMIANTYDNSMLYTDYLLSLLMQDLNKVASKFDKSVLLYASDHGESLGENGLYLHSLPYSIAPEFQTKVAAMLYSPSKNFLSSLRRLEKAKLSHDFIFSSLLGFFGISTSFYDKSLDIFAN